MVTVTAILSSMAPLTKPSRSSQSETLTVRVWLVAVS